MTAWVAAGGAIGAAARRQGLATLERAEVLMYRAHGKAAHP